MATNRLSDRQRQCVHLSATMTDKEIARSLGVSPGTVNKHIQQAMARLGVNTRKSALRVLGYAAPPPQDPVSTRAFPVSTAGAETDRIAIPGRPAPEAVWTYAPPPRGRVLRLALVFGVFLVASIVAVGGAAILNAGLDLTQAAAPDHVR